MLGEHVTVSALGETLLCLDAFLGFLLLYGLDHLAAERVDRLVRSPSTLPCSLSTTAHRPHVADALPDGPVGVSAPSTGTTPCC